KRRMYLTKERTEKLEEYYQNHIAFPYPDQETREFLANECGITYPQVTKWFSNRRNKDK
ncbi:hypothetical protein HELRODRAFT_148340, partial [Helobdella robusta]|uniref:Homeobox domain-containing protein n=1 Tax=Helobdella robusta TaxID=6412 RepID=T1EK76_HELRO